MSEVACAVGGTSLDGWFTAFVLLPHRSGVLPFGRRARPAIEYVSGEEGLCPTLHCEVRVLALRPSMLAFFLKYVDIQTLNFISAPGSRRGPRGKWRWLRSLVVPPLRLTSDVVPSCPCTAMKSRRSSRPQPMGSGGDATPAKSLGRTGDSTF